MSIYLSRHSAALEVSKVATLGAIVNSDAHGLENLEECWWMSGVIVTER